MITRSILYNHISQRFQGYQLWDLLFTAVGIDFFPVDHQCKWFQFDSEEFCECFHH